MRAVRFNRAHALYNGGEVASFPATQAEELIAAGVAEAWQPEQATEGEGEAATDPADTGAEGSEPPAAAGDPTIA